MNENAAVGARWTESGEGKTAWPFATRQLMLGLVCAVPEEFPVSPTDWTALLSSVGVPRSSWMQRHGVAPDLGTEEFFNFMNPGIGGVPVYGFMVLITAFAVLIGPVNYFYLRRKRWLWLLLVTVPAMALVTSVLLVGYSVAAHGFSIRSRIRSLTVLDQKSHSAVTVARLALFAGVAPRAACSSPRKRPSIRCSRQWSSRARWRSTGPRTNRCQSGWLLSRTRTQFLTVRHAEQPDRVDVKPGQNGGLAIVNGLPWELEAVLVADASGRLLWARNVLPKASEPLADVSETNRMDFVRLLGRNRPELPDNFSSPVFNPLVGRRLRPFNFMAQHFGGAFRFEPDGAADSNVVERPFGQKDVPLAALLPGGPPPESRGRDGSRTDNRTSGLPLTARLLLS